MSEMIKTPKIQDFIVEMDKNERAVKAKVEYEVILENSCDFVIARKTAKTCRTLAIIVSQNLFYLKDDNTGEIENINLANIKNYLKDLGERNIKLSNVKWIKGISKSSCEAIITCISDSVFVEMCKHNIYFPNLKMGDFRICAQEDIKFLEYIFNSIPNLDNMRKYTKSFVEFAYLIKERMGTNEARYFVEKYIDSAIDYVDFFTSSYRGGTQQYGVLWGLLTDERYKIDFRRFVEYLFFDIYAQGKSSLISDFFRNYQDYLTMQLELYGVIKEKYPKHFETEHDILALKTSLNRFKIEEEKFKKEMEKYKELEFADGMYLIKLPETSEDLKKEGNALNHCVGGYGSRITNGQCGVVFLRKKYFEEEPLITIEVINDRIVQMQGGEKRRPNPSEIHFIRKWAYEKKLRLCA